METCMNDLKKNIYIYQTEDLLWEGGVIALFFPFSLRKFFLSFSPCCSCHVYRCADGVYR